MYFDKVNFYNQKIKFIQDKTKNYSVFSVSLWCISLFAVESIIVVKASFSDNVAAATENDRMLQIPTEIRRSNPFLSAMLEVRSHAHPFDIETRPTGDANPERGIRRAVGGWAVVVDRQGVCAGLGKLGWSIQRAADAEGAAVEDVGINHGGLHILMTQQFLHSSNIVTRLQ